MPLPAIIGAAQSILQPITQHLTNVKNRKFTREMYNRQRQDALSDWEMQNAYNSPAQQMARFKEAGLNPHLIYGQGNEGATVRSSNPSGGQATAPDINLGQMYSFAYKSNQADLSAANLEFLKARENQVKAQTVKTLADVDLTKQNVSRGAIKLAIENQLQDVSVMKGTYEADLVKEKYNEQYWKSFFAERVGNLGIEKTIEQIKNLKTFNDLSITRKAEIENRIENLKRDGKLKDYEIKLNERGAQKNDSLFERMVTELFDLIFK